MRFTSFIACSIDGFIAKKDGDISWLIEESSKSNDDFGYNDFIASIDAVAFGRNSFEKVLTFDKWPYDNISVVIVSKTLSRSNLPVDISDKVDIYSGEIEGLASYFENRRLFNIYVDGGALISSFLAKDMLDEITITQIPILLNDGVRLFGEVGGVKKLRLLHSNAYNNGFVQNKYEIIKEYI